MRQKFSAGSKCECMCHGKAGIIEYCGYCSSSHRRMNTNQRLQKVGYSLLGGDLKTCD